MQRRDYETLASGFIAGWRAGVEPYREKPAAYGIRKDAWEEAVAAVGAMVKTNNSGFDYEKWRAEIKWAVR